MLIIELDGSQHADRIAADTERTRYLEGLGYEVMRVWNADVKNNLEGVLETIYGCAARRRMAPSSGLRPPSPQGEKDKPAAD
jgi:very-short-patch-repair endonuclease